MVRAICFFIVINTALCNSFNANIPIQHLINNISWHCKYSLFPSNAKTTINITEILKANAHKKSCISFNSEFIDKFDLYKKEEMILCPTEDNIQNVEYISTARSAHPESNNRDIAIIEGYKLLETKSELKEKGRRMYAYRIERVERAIKKSK